MSDIITVLIPTSLVILASILELVVQSRQLKSLREELEGTKAIIKDTADLRNAILHELEGTWSLVGSFSKFQNDEIQHHSEGLLILGWIPGKSHYDATYCYSVCKAGESKMLVTAICQGHSEGDIEFKNKATLVLSMKVISRTDLSMQANYNKNFTLALNITRNRDMLHTNRITSNFETPSTVGELVFSRVS